VWVWEGQVALPAQNHYQYTPRFPWVTMQGRSNLSRDDHVQLDGVVTNVFAGGQFEVKTDAGPMVRAQLSGRMRKNRIRVILGDRVTVALSPYDLTHGMITYRLK
jgi:translation initiation factor IF-1